VEREENPKAPALMARHGPAQRGASKKPSGEAVVTTPPPPERASSLSSPTLNHTSSPRNQIQPNPTRRQEKGSERIHQHRGDRSGCESPPGPKICSLRSALAAARREEGDGRLEEGTGEGRKRSRRACAVRWCAQAVRRARRGPAIRLLLRVLRCFGTEFLGIQSPDERFLWCRRAAAALSVCDPPPHQGLSLL